jgi:hypothetical protein
MKKDVSFYDFLLRIAADHNISPKKEYTLRLPADKKTIKRFTQSVATEVRIFDGYRERPYMLSENIRNDIALGTGIELRRLGLKSLDTIVAESGAEVKYSRCTISEGNGWYSKGMRVAYKDIYCEY